MDKAFGNGLGVPNGEPEKRVWLWKENLGWLWTDEEFYPFCIRILLRAGFISTEQVRIVYCSTITGMNDGLNGPIRD